MRAVEFDVTMPRLILARSLGRVSQSAVFGRLSGLRHREVPEAEIPGGEWAALRVLGCGICGSDIGNLTYLSSPLMEPFGSFPAVLGHEILATVESVGSGVTRVAPGSRVSVDPIISCHVRGHRGTAGLSVLPERPPRYLRDGRRGRTSEDRKRESISRGLTIGYHRDLPGGWGERMVAHQSQLFPLDPRISSRAAVLVEPLSISVHAVLNAPPEAGEEVLVIGSGPIAFGTIWALRATGFEGTVVAQTKAAT